MKILILGATGATGRILVQGALDRGHHVTALARRPEAVTVRHERLRVVQGDVLQRATLEAALPGHDAVIYAVGSGNMGRSTVRTEGARNVVAAMRAAGVRKLIAMSGLGAGETRKNLGFVMDKIVAPLILGRLLEDQNGLEAAITPSDLDWIIVRPGELRDEPGRGAWKLSKDGRGLSRGVSRHDVAAFMLDGLASAEHHRQPIAIGY